MLKLWSSPSSQTTPKASTTERNPFDVPRLNPVAAASADPPPGSSRIPSFPHHHLLNAPRPTPPFVDSSASRNNSFSTNPTSNAQLLLSPSDLGPLTPHAANNFAAVAAALPSTQLTLNPPIFKMKQPPPPRNQQPQNQQPLQLHLHLQDLPTKSHPDMSSVTPSSSSSPDHSISPARGQLHVKIIQARGLNVHLNQARPYVVVQFEQAEFVSREATFDADKELRGFATNLSRNSSTTALSSLNAIAIGKAFETAARSKSAHTPSSSVSSGNSSIPSLKLTNGSANDSDHTSGTTTPSVLGGFSAHNPVWKHEVTL